MSSLEELLREVYNQGYEHAQATSESEVVTFEDWFNQRNPFSPPKDLSKIYTVQYNSEQYKILQDFWIQLGNTQAENLHSYNGLDWFKVKLKNEIKNND